MSVEFQQEHIVSPITVFDVWKEILNKHPEIVRQEAMVYLECQHNQKPNIRQRMILPRERIEWSDNEDDFWGQPKQVKTIGARVGVRPKDFDSQIDYSGAGRWFNEGDILTIEPDSEMSFIFIDFESEPSVETLNLILNTFKEWRQDWYLMDSGGSYHLIIDELIESIAVPYRLGEAIVDLAKNLPPIKSKFYGSIGDFLLKNWYKEEKLKPWVKDIFNYFGHKEDPISEGKYLFPIDMRYIAHVVGGFIEGNYSENNLRVSSKHGSVPIMVAKKTGEIITIFDNSKNSFNRKQMTLPGI